MNFKYPILIFLFLSFRLTASANFNFNPRCVDAYEAIFDLKLNEASSIIREIKQQEPQNGVALLLDNYVDYYGLLVSENKADYEKFKDRRSTRISSLEENDKNSPYYLYSQAEIYLQWAFLRAKFGDYFSSAMDAKKAGNLLKDNAQKYPDFTPNKISLALVNIFFGSIPANLKGVTRFLGMGGSTQLGVKQLEGLRTELPKTKYGFYNSEVIFFLCTVDIDVMHDVNGYSKLMLYLSGMPDSSLFKVYLQGYVASKTAHNDEAITYLEARPKSNQYTYLPNLDYVLGNALLNRLDNNASAPLLSYISNFRGTNKIKDTYLKLAYYYFLQNDMERYNNYIKLVKTRGYAIDEKDKQALREANDTRPNLDLLKTRFYFDGGYFNKALAQLTGKNAEDFKISRDKIEFYYRLGRIYEKTDKLNDAVLNYQRAINVGKTSSYYFAANAAISIGRIYEQKREYDKAADYYNQALDMPAHEYQTSIDNDAKDGLRRINR